MDGLSADASFLKEGGEPFFRLGEVSDPHAHQQTSSLLQGE